MLTYSTCTQLVAKREAIRAGAAIAVTSNYTLSKAELKLARGNDRYVWIRTCTIGCDHHRRGTTRLLCRDKSTRELVSWKKCQLLSKPPRQREQFEKCNTTRCVTIVSIFFFSFYNVTHLIFFFCLERFSRKTAVTCCTFFFSSPPSTAKNN